MKSNSMFEEIKKFGLIFMPINWLICLIVTLVLKFVAPEGWWLGYLLGSMTSFLTFGLHMKAVGYPDDAKGATRRKILCSYPVRLIFSALILGLSWFSTYKAQGTLLDGAFNFIATFIGLVVIKFVLIVFAIVLEIVKKNKNKNSIKPSSTVEASMTVSEMAQKLNEYQKDEGGMDGKND